MFVWEGRGGMSGEGGGLDGNLVCYKDSNVGGDGGI